MTQEAQVSHFGVMIRVYAHPTREISLLQGQYLVPRRQAPQLQPLWSHVAHPHLQARQETAPSEQADAGAGIDDPAVPARLGAAASAVY